MRLVCEVVFTPTSHIMYLSSQAIYPIQVDSFGNWLFCFSVDYALFFVVGAVEDVNEKILYEFHLCVCMCKSFNNILTHQYFCRRSRLFESYVILYEYIWY